MIDCVINGRHITQTSYCMIIYFEEERYLKAIYDKNVIKWSNTLKGEIIGIFYKWILNARYSILYVYIE